jgi:hypothetical protein
VDAVPALTQRTSTSLACEVAKGSVVTELVPLHWPLTTEPSRAGGDPAAGAVVVVVGAVVVVGEAVVVVVVGGLPGVTPPLSVVYRSSLFAVAMHTSVDAQDTLLSSFVVPPVSDCHVNPPLPLPSSDSVVPAPPAQQVRLLAQLTELSHPSLDGKLSGLQVIPEFVLVTATVPPPPRLAPPARQSVVPVVHETAKRPPILLKTVDEDIDHEAPLEVVDIAVEGPVGEN